MIPYKTVIFDFDGTLVDSVPGIVHSIRLLLEQCERPAMTDAELLACVGPPIHQFFVDLLGFSYEELDNAIELYRQIFDREALSMLRVYPGIPELLRDLKQAGVRLGVASCKVQRGCTEQSNLLGIAQYFDVVCGSRPERNLFEKSDILRLALEELNAGLDDTVMVGDRMYDIIAANEVGLPSIGVLYCGSGSREELSEHNPLHIVQTVEELRALLL